MTRTVVLIDGENLSARCNEMMRQGRSPRADTVIEGDHFVWNSSFLSEHLWDVLRISYHTSLVGDEDSISRCRAHIASIDYKCRAEVKGLFENKQLYRTSSGRLIPQIKKRSSKSRKESVCDIAISVEALRACYRDHASKILIVSGDGDFISLYQEIMHSGKEVIVGALSSGLSSAVPLEVDHFVDLDPYFFQN